MPVYIYPTPKFIMGNKLPLTEFLINATFSKVEKGSVFSSSEIYKMYWLYTSLQNPFLCALLFYSCLSIHLQKLHNRKKSPIRQFLIFIVL
jgi:uncharacterized membrane protein YhaH (DUF805 family)